MNEKQQPTSQKPRWRFSQAKYHRWDFFLGQLLIATDIKRPDPEIQTAFPSWLLGPENGTQP